MAKVSLITTAVTTSLIALGLTFASPAGAAPGAPQTISIPRIGINATIGASLAVGPIFWPEVGRPGQGTTIAIAGHDVTPVPGFHGHGPFHNIDELRRGDRITITWHGIRHTYIVTGHRIIPSTNMHIADLTRYERLLLTTCWPRGSSAYRLVVYARPLLDTPSRARTNRTGRANG
jgi:LPXTG-site transpeptidase (sortase) family protein